MVHAKETRPKRFDMSRLSGASYCLSRRRWAGTTKETWQKEGPQQNHLSCKKNNAESVEEATCTYPVPFMATDPKTIGLHINVCQQRPVSASSEMPMPRN